MRSAQVVSFQKKKAKQQNNNKRQIDMYVLALELQTLSLMINDLRSRVSQIEKQVHVGEITEADRALLSNLDCIFEKSQPTTSAIPSTDPESPVLAPAPRLG